MPDCPIEDVWTRSLTLWIPHFPSKYPVAIRIEGLENHTGNTIATIVPIPEFIQKLERCEITCEDVSLEWEPEKVVLHLFNMGFGGVVFKAASYADPMPLPGTFGSIRLRNIVGSSDLSLGDAGFNAASSEGSMLYPEIFESALFQDMEEVLNETSDLERFAFPGIPGTNQRFTGSSPWTYNANRSIMANPASSVMGRSPASFGNFQSMSNSPASFITSQSVFSSPASFASSRSMFNSPASFTTAHSPFNPVNPAMGQPSTTPAMVTIQEEQPANFTGPLEKLNQHYHSQLREKQLILSFDAELNWSGKGQHVTFSPGEVVPLTVLSHLGSSMTATVDKVLCRRIALARKTMRCPRTLSLANALEEVYHLQNLRHSHIVQLVGTYLQSRNLAILMYPAADCHLGTFLEDTADMMSRSVLEYEIRREFLSSSLSCLASAVEFVHSHVTRHMDIKPQNILIKRSPEYLDEDDNPNFELQRWRVYLADFGLSRSYAAHEHSQTDGPAPRTPRYCAPEVYQSERRGRSADIFSLGCVFIEILNTYIGFHPQDFADYRQGEEGGDESFHANLERVSSWISSKWKLDPQLYMVRQKISNLLEFLEKMTQRDPTKRPVAAQVKSFFRPRDCCNRHPEPYVAYEGPIFGFQT